MSLPIANGIAILLAAFAVGAFLYGQPAGGVVLIVLAVVLVLWARRGAGKR